MEDGLHTSLIKQTQEANAIGRLLCKAWGLHTVLCHQKSQALIVGNPSFTKTYQHKLKVNSNMLLDFQRC